VRLVTFNLGLRLKINQFGGQTARIGGDDGGILRRSREIFVGWRRTVASRSGGRQGTSRSANISSTRGVLLVIGEVAVAAEGC